MKARDWSSSMFMKSVRVRGTVAPEMGGGSAVAPPTFSWGQRLSLAPPFFGAVFILCLSGTTASVRQTQGGHRLLLTSDFRIKISSKIESFLEVLPKIN